MSTIMKLLFPREGGRSNAHTFVIGDMLVPDQQYSFYGHIIDMSHREDIPAKPFMELKRMDQMQMVIDLEGNEHIPGDLDFYICRASEFRKVPDMEATTRNKAIMKFLKALDPTSFVIVEMSW